MQIHLSDVTSCEGKTIQISTELEMETVSFQMGEFPVLKKRTGRSGDHEYRK